MGWRNEDIDYYEYLIIESEVIMESSDNYVALFDHIDQTILMISLKNFR